MDERASAAVVERLWRLFDARDWDAAAELIDPDVVVDWPATGERFRGRDAFLAVQRDYPEPWGRIHVRRIVADGERVAAEVAFSEAPAPFRVASFCELRDGRVVRATEYWVTAGEEEPPAWRSAYAERAEPDAG